MNLHLKRMLAAGCCALIVFLSSIRLFLPLTASGYGAEDCAALAEEILSKESGGDPAHWIQNTLPSRAGDSAADWYAMTAVQRGFDCSAYGDAMRSVLDSMDEPSATSRERIALTYIACTGQQSPACTEILESSAGRQGIMSWIFALHLMNNGVTSEKITQLQTVTELAGRQAQDGGWSLTGDFGDPDVTAMTLQSLAPYRDAPEAKDAVTRGVAYLASVQLDSGAYRSFGTENPESTAQVWIALCALDIDPLRDERFIKNGCTLLDGIMQFRLSPGCYAHEAGGGESSLAARQIFQALTAEDMLRNGAGSLMLFHGAAPSLPREAVPAQTDPPKPQQTAPAAHSDTEQSAGADTPQTTAAASGTSDPAGTTAESSAAVPASETAAAEESGTTALPQSAAEVICTTAPPADARSDAEKYPYRIPLTAAVWAGGALLAVICICRKKRSPKTYLTVAGSCVILTALVWFIKIESPENYYQSELKTGGGTVTMAIRCDVICGLAGSEAYPADGVIMPLTEFSIEPEESALALLYDAVKAYTLQIEVDGVSGETVETAYVRGIASLYEFDFGDLSGWTYTVNGVRPSVGCGAYHLKDGDRVVWEYTVSL